MEPNRIKRLLAMRPFKPFKLILPSDRELEVPHPEFMAISPFGNAAVVWDKQGVEELIDLRWVVSLKETRRSVRRR